VFQGVDAGIDRDHPAGSLLGVRRDPTTDGMHRCDHARSTSTGTTQVTADPGTAVAGQPVTLTATVTGAGATPTGPVAFTASNGSLIGCGTQPLSGGVATPTVPCCTPGHTTSR
jgi:hypothetical protein